MQVHIILIVYFLIYVKHLNVRKSKQNSFLFHYTYASFNPLFLNPLIYDHYVIKAKKIKTLITEYLNSKQ